MMLLLAVVNYSAAQDAGAIAPSPMESSGPALTVPALLAVVASVLAWFY